MKKILILAVLAVACADDKSNGEPKAEPQAQEPAAAVPAVITVDHILIGVQGHPRMRVQRTEEEARQLVADIEAKLESGEDWTALKQQYSDDPGRDGVKGGPYTMDENQRPRDMEKISQGTFARSDMAKAFGDVSYTLQVGEIGVAQFQRNATGAGDSPFGFHIIKRVK